MWPGQRFSIISMLSPAAAFCLPAVCDNHEPDIAVTPNLFRSVQSDIKITHTRTEDFSSINQFSTMLLSCFVVKETLIQTHLRHIAGNQLFKLFLYKTLLLQAITPADCHLPQQNPQKAAFDSAFTVDLASSSAYSLSKAKATFVFFNVNEFSNHSLSLFQLFSSQNEWRKLHVLSLPELVRCFDVIEIVFVYVGINFFLLFFFFSS